MGDLQEYKELQETIRELDMKGSYQELLDHTIRYKDMAESLFGTGHAQYAAALNEYAGAFRNLGRYEEAEKVYDDALRIMGAACGENTFEYATVLNNMAGMCRLSGQYEKSEETFLRVKDLYAAILGTSHFLYLSCLNNLGLLYQDMGRYDEAAGLHEECLRTFHDPDQHNDIAEATTLVNLASARMGEKRNCEAEPLLKKAIAVYEKTTGRAHPLCAHALNTLAALSAEEGRPEEAKQYLEESLQIVEKAYGRDSDSYGLVYRNLQSVKKVLEEKNGAEGGTAL